MNWDKQRKELIRRLMSSGYLGKADVIEAMSKVPRHLFIPEGSRNNAYIDMPVLIGFGQTISAPHMVAMMTEALDVKPHHRVLEVGTGSGYQAAVLAELLSSGALYTLERVPELAKKAKDALKRYPNVHVVYAEGTLGYEPEAPFDRILVTAGAPRIPAALLEQLGGDGKLLIPVGGRELQELVLVEKERGVIKKKNLGGCMFVPLLGADGW